MSTPSTANLHGSESEDKMTAPQVAIEQTSTPTDSAVVTTPTPLTMEQAVRQVAELRAAYGGSRARVAEFRQAWEQAAADMLAEEASLRRAVQDAEGQLRVMALERFQVTGERQVGPGVSIRLVTQVEYDAGQALAWAMERKMALQLDARAFESIAKADPSAVPCATVVQVPQATLASDLAAALPQGG